jgi:hypothetical protein
MGRTVGHILKAQDVKLEGQFQLDLFQAGLSGSQNVNDTSSTPPTARVVENRPDCAVVEITCSCGTKTSLKCEYIGADASVGQVPDQTK